MYNWNLYKDGNRVAYIVCDDDYDEEDVMNEFLPFIEEEELEILIMQEYIGVYYLSAGYMMAREPETFSGFSMN